MKEKVVTVIPARGGSKGIPRKNVREIKNVPLIAYSILDAQESKYVDKVFVSTDSPEIASVAKFYDAEVIHRPEVFSSDTASSESALIHSLSEIESLNIYPDLIVFLQCTSPIRSGLDIDLAIEKIKAEQADSLLSVSPSHKFIWEEKNGIVRSVNYDFLNRPRRQDMSPQYVENGSIYIFKPWVLKKLDNRLGGKISLFPMSEVAAWEIDSEFDFEMAEILMQKEGQC